MIELGALLGAMLLTFAIFQTLGQMDSGSVNDGPVMIVTLVGAPIVGALWGAAMGAAIHYVANVTALDLIGTLFRTFAHTL
jgi:hypothetical protein